MVLDVLLIRERQLLLSLNVDQRIAAGGGVLVVQLKTED
jgi:hypothetical protein